MYTKKSTAVDATAQSIQLTQEDLIVELNQFYVEITGDGISEFYKKHLLEMSLEAILEIIEEKKDILHAQLWAELDAENNAQVLHMIEEAERCDSFAYNDMM